MKENAKTKSKRVEGKFNKTDRRDAAKIDSKIFSTLDLKNRYFHVSIEQSSKEYTTFVVSTDQYEFLRMPFGLCILPAIF